MRLVRFEGDPAGEGYVEAQVDPKDCLVFVAKKVALGPPDGDEVSLRWQEFVVYRLYTYWWFIFAVPVCETAGMNGLRRAWRYYYKKELQKWPEFRDDEDMPGYFGADNIRAVSAVASKVAAGPPGKTQPSLLWAKFVVECWPRTGYAREEWPEYQKSNSSEWKTEWWE
ncbi:MAG: hypothetical protein KC416_02385 [Myxococcales bacterium]|nr:hypothetical protein [Myxococcales bacterium]